MSQEIGQYSEDISQSQFSSPRRGSQIEQQQDSKNQEQNNEQIEQNPKKKRKINKERAKRPKLTSDLLLGEKGFQDLYTDFPGLILKYYRGKGHELQDIQYLITLYENWQKRVFPEAKSFNHFVEGLERIGSNKAGVLLFKDAKIQDKRKQMESEDANKENSGNLYNSQSHNSQKHQNGDFDYNRQKSQERLDDFEVPNGQEIGQSNYFDDFGDQALQNNQQDDIDVVPDDMLD